jgi:hypothetical protein
LGVAEQSTKHWLVIQARDSKYADIEGRAYEYPRHIPQAQRVAVGDVLVVAVPKASAPDGRRILGFGRVGSIQGQGTDRLIASYDRYRKLSMPATFEEIGGDPRKNQTNSINPIDSGIAKKLLEREGIAGIESLPMVAGEATRQEPPPADYALREVLHDAVVKDLLGPASGADEDILGTSVRDRYLVGKLAPKESSIDQADTGDLAESSSDGGEDGSAEGATLMSQSIVPSSFGLTFCVDASCERLEVEASWGHYRKAESEVHVTEAGNPKRVWKRRAAGGKVTLDLQPGEVAPLVPDAEQAEVFVRGVVRPPTAAGEKIVTLFLVNDQQAPETNQDEAWLFQAQLSIRAPDGADAFRRRPTGESTSDDDERAALAMLYRDKVEFAVGHGVSVHWALSARRADRATEVRTQVVPWYDVPVTEAPTAADLPGLANLVLDMRALADLDEAALAKTLAILHQQYTAWIDGQQARVAAKALGEHERSAVEALEKCRRTAERLKAGIEKVLGDPRALEAFRFANRAMWQQRVRSLYALERRRGKDTKLEEIDVAKNRSWRPFQLAFVLLSIPSLADPKHSDRTDPAAAVADLLWFPTGGGKTEAYLGVAAFAMAIRRLQGPLGGLDHADGLTVIMRYTLRLLTIQQFQRASTLLCAMEVIRRKAVAKGDERWGDTPFRIGLWVGQRATPNTTADAQQAIQNARGNQWRQLGTGTPAQLSSCPWCGAEIQPGRDVVVKTSPNYFGRTFTFCSDALGRCDFTPSKAPDEGLPVVVVDEEIYRLLPSMMIATVDKFAQMPWRGEVQTLFGRVSGRCQRHGFVSPDDEDKGNHAATRGLPRVVHQAHGFLRPPDLIIQDELHLISGPLGTMVGLYETAVDELATWDLEGKRVRPKVIASTATVRKAREQVHGLFQRQLQIFPPHGLDASDNFFARQREVTKEKPGRRYMGICAPGASRPSVLIRVYVAFLTAAQRLRELYGEAADPWLTTVGYFNSLRELGGMRRLAEDDVRTRAFRVNFGELERPGLAQRDVRQIQELTSRASSSDIPRILDRMEVTFPALGVKKDPSPIDIVLATNMLSVGVDVQRLGLMVVNGQPKTTAEYIQATSRVGRHKPGFVCTVLNWSRPRDLSHYESFEHYHATFYQHVEALSVTPFAPRAVDRGLTGVMASLLRLQGLDLNANEGAGRLTSAGDPKAKAVTASVAARAWSVSEAVAVKDRAEQLAKERVDQWVYEAQKGGRTLGYKGKKDGTTVGLLKAPGPQPWETFTTPTSMREVEPNVSLILGGLDGVDTPKWEPAATPAGTVPEVDE